MSNAVETKLAGDYLARYRTLADARLATVLEERGRRFDALPFGAGRYHAHLREYVLRGGKRIRGALVLLGFEAVTGRDGVEILDRSLAFELAHAHLLAIDDIMDRDEMRRGGKALHVLATETARDAGSRDPAHRGTSAAILLSMTAEQLGLSLLAAEPSVPGALAWYAEVMEAVTTGQLLDVCAEDVPSAKADELSVIHRLKTGVYTTEGPLVLGALLGGISRDDSRTRALQGWAGPVGEAFQLVDDIVSLLGNPEETGKPVASDLRQGKRTAVIDAAIGALSGGARRRFLSLLGRPLDDFEALEARSLVLDSGAPDLVRDRARSLAAQASASLHNAALHAPARSVLDSLAHLIVERQN